MISSLKIFLVINIKNSSDLFNIFPMLFYNIKLKPMNELHFYWKVNIKTIIAYYIYL